MGISFSIPCDPCINKSFQWLDNKGGYTLNLEKNKVALKETMEELIARRDDLSCTVTREENRGRKRLSEVQVWLNRVDNIEQTVKELLRDRNVELQMPSPNHPSLRNVSGTQETSPSHGLCYKKSSMSRYRYGKKIFLTLRKVENLKSSGVFQVVAHQAPTQEVDQIPLPPDITGQETMLDKAWKRLTEDGVGKMGMYGMGGVGKTTLLTQLNNKFSNLRRGTYDFVIWVVVSKELQVSKIQDHIADKLDLRGVGWNEKDESKKAIVIYNFLKDKRFVLFLDDIWEKVDLTVIGVPPPTKNNGCKVAFTTRSKGVCTSMGDRDPMEVQCLTEKDAFDLFEKKVGETILESDPEILELARFVARKCYGLPLALNVIGETMSCKKTIREWRHARDVLASYAIEFDGMEDRILLVLKYSYEEQCLLYCALFPEDGQIQKGKLIDYWICEGIIDGSEGIEKAENKGYEIICSLVRVSLLMEAGTDCVRMHDVIREMALWIATDLGREKEAFIVRAGVGLNEMPKVENWNVVRRMSLMENKIDHLGGSPECRQLETLLLQKTNLSNISSEFFKFMPKLVVLDLSANSDLFGLPDGISELGSLQYLNLSSTGLRDLPDISGLVALQYLNLSSTGIHELPKGLQELKKLIHLDLEHTKGLKSIAGISSLYNLKVLKLFPSGISLDLNTAKELETLENLEILTLAIEVPSWIKKFLSSHRLTRCTQYLEIRGLHLESSGIALPLTMGKLRELFVKSCIVSEICINNKIVSPLQNPRNPNFLSLSKVFIQLCEGLKELTWIMFAPNLESLTVWEAQQVRYNKPR